MDKPQAVAQSSGDSDSSAAMMGEAEVVFASGPAIPPLYDRENLSAGAQIRGPGLVIQMDSTAVITPEWSGTVDPYGNLVLEPN